MEHACQMCWAEENRQELQIEMAQLLETGHQKRESHFPRAAPHSSTPFQVGKQHLPGRTDNEIKNYWRTRVQKQARLLNIDPSTTATHDATAFLELAAVRSCSLWSTPTLLHKMHHHQTSSSSSFNGTTSLTDHHFDHSQPIVNIIPNPAHNNTKPVIYTSAPPMPNLAPPSISTSARQSQLHQPAAPLPNYYNYSVPAAGINNIIGTSNYSQLDHDFSDQVQSLPQSSWGDQGVGHATANIGYNYNTDLEQSCNSSTIHNGYGDHEMLGNCTVASTSALQPYFDPNSTHHQCHDMERADLAYADVANTLWNMDDIWQNI